MGDFSSIFFAFHSVHQFSLNKAITAIYQIKYVASFRKVQACRGTLAGKPFWGRHFGGSMKVSEGSYCSGSSVGEGFGEMGLGKDWHHAPVGVCLMSRTGA